MDYAIRAKERILDRLNEANTENVLEVCRDVLVALDLCRDLFKACDYAYKGRDIIRDVLIDLNSARDQGYENSEERDRLERLAYELDRVFYNLQHEES